VARVTWECATSTLQANPAAGVAIVLSNWRYRRGRALDDAETACVTTIYEQEHGTSAAKRPKPWWRFY
jgi:hypothetical protein